MSDSKQRIDLYLVDRGLMPSRAQAQSAIMEGRVCVDGITVRRPAQKIYADQEVSVADPDHQYVSRGGKKLAHALDVFSLSPEGLVALDLGASTGGFTDVLRQRGARQVFALDVGHGQLHPRLACDPCVISLEGLNARDLSRAHLDLQPDILVCDVSFISLRLALPPALALMRAPAWMVVLIKPQFEAGRHALNKKGVVTDPKIHHLVCDDFKTWFAQSYGQWEEIGLAESPITGPEGNHEFLFAARLTLE